MVDRKRIEKLHRKYAKSDRHFELVYSHCQIVEEIALSCADTYSKEVDLDLLSTAALLHDIASYMFMDENAAIDTDYYQLHAVFGAELAVQEGFGAAVAECIRSHQNLGTTFREFESVGWRMPERDYLTQSIEAELLAYADRFHSKTPVFRQLSGVESSLQRGFPGQEVRLQAWSKKFGVPDIDTLSKKYGHPVE